MSELQSFYDEHAAHARLHEEQRERATNLILSITILLVGLITFAKLAYWSFPAAVCIVLLGGFGFLFAGKHYERFRLRTEIMKLTRLEIEQLFQQPAYVPKPMSVLRNNGERDHYRDFDWPSFHGSRNVWQPGAKSWIARQRLHVFWEGIHVLVVGIGLGLCAVILCGSKVREDAKPIKVEVVSPATPPTVKVELLPSTPKADVPKATRP